AQLQRTTDRWIALESRARAFAGRYTGPDDKLLPGALYVTLAGFGGSILARGRRSLVARAGLPALASLAAFAYVYPAMSYNVVRLTWRDAAAAGVVPESLPGAEAAAEQYRRAKDWGAQAWASVQGGGK
ncbi:hypothetical protein HK405_008806, partial [Cladochytrium tenue]